jgi:ParB family chromosome partitioning protein
MPKRPSGTVRQALMSRSPHGVADLVDEVVEVRELDIDRIAPNPNQPRRQIDATALDQLAKSIETHGLLQPIIVRPARDGYELIAGSRRLRAVESLGRPRITAIVLHKGDSAILALIENLQRADLDPLDEAEALSALKEHGDHTLEALQLLIGRSQSYLSEIMSLLKLPEAILAEVRALAAEGRSVPRASLVELARIKDKQQQTATWKRIVEGETRRADLRTARVTPAAPATNAPALTRRLVGLNSLIERTTDADTWRDPAVRERLKELRSRIDSLLAEAE